MPSLFRRKSADLVSDATATVTSESEQSAASKPKAYTPSKKELGVATPKRTSAQRRHDTAAAPANRREAYKQMRERQKVERAEASAGMRAGDERYLLARDRGPERALVRNIVDSKRTAGTWFFAGAIVVFVGSTAAMPQQVRLGANLLWAILAIAVVVDSVLISRKVKSLVSTRFPDSTQRMGSLYLYGIMRGLTFRRMRVPKPQVELGAKI
ncbi:DUF3043 domain-containing protein [Amorphoplanes digitatis]|uniref:DUF3043 domain-containing protein n=1 Tax=Actinoplanes digitatis TaxID=1868 RepID=A0A7W7MTA4_9ACTN|nr:DUF3043 domain-containing protein [Actinoplanes digitatis]MBB4765575.1 hypothetical protein [Actinoplanes digitatis]BFE75429.1 DUF3043 domain-containing protein [Actinoplanes digitatis]GID93534.1 membrane protein [Actinoplanes digitatis]